MAENQQDHRIQHRPHYVKNAGSLPKNAVIFAPNQDHVEVSCNRREGGKKWSAVQSNSTWDTARWNKHGAKARAND